MENTQSNLKTFLMRKSAWNESVYCYHNSGLYVLPAEKTLDGRDVAGLLSKKNVAMLLDQARKGFDYIIVDTPPIGVLADAGNVTSACDGVIVAVRKDQSQIREVIETLEQILERKTKLLGFVMNQVQGGFENYGYGNYGYGAYGNSTGLQ